MTDKRPLWVLVIACALLFVFGGKGGAIFTPPPIDAEGLHVLIIEETADRNNLPVSQAAVLQSIQLRSYVQEKNGNYRQLDDDSNMELAAQKWKDAMLLPRDSLPWLIVSNKGGYTGPLPETLEETMAILKKWGE